MRKNKVLLLSSALILTGLLALGCDSKPTPTAAAKDAPVAKTVNKAAASGGIKVLPAAQPLSNGKTPQGYTVVGNEVFVNNRTCAQTGSPLAEDALDKFQSRVVYEGPIEQFKGKTFVFNQCCGMCIKSFPEKWAQERDAIMAKHRITTLN